MFSTGDVDAVAEVVAADYVDHQGLDGVELHGPDGLRRVVAAARRAYADLEVTIEDLVADDERVGARLRWRGTNAAGARVDRQTIELLRVVDAKAVEHWGAQLGGGS